MAKRKTGGGLSRSQRVRQQRQHASDINADLRAAGVSSADRKIIMNDVKREMRAGLPRK